MAGVEERDVDGGIALILYAPATDAESLRSALLASEVVASGRARVGPVEALPDVDWSEEWKRGLRALEIGDRLVIRPSFVASPDAGDASPRSELVIDPGQAFGTGHHASTRLALEVMALDPTAWRADQRVLDVGTGSGVLALAALVFGAGRAVGLDLDPLSPPEAAKWARRNQLSDRAHFWLGPIDTIAGRSFDWVLANMLRRETEPIAEPLAAAVAPGGRLVLSGLLAVECEAVGRRFESLGLVGVRGLEHRDDAGDHWGALLMERPASSPPASAGARSSR